MYTLLNVTYDDMLDSFSHESLMLLGFSKKGRQYLKQNRKNIQTEIISKVDKRSAKSGSLALQVRTDRLFEQVMGVDQNFGQRPIEV